MLMTTWQNEWQSRIPWGPTQLRCNLSRSGRIGTPKRCKLGEMSELGRILSDIDDNLAERVAITNSLRADFTPSQSVKIRSGRVRTPKR
eukprot:352217-Prorocentrum_lima.AAC.2